MRPRLARFSFPVPGFYLMEVAASSLAARAGGLFPGFGPALVLVRRWRTPARPLLGLSLGQILAQGGSLALAARRFGPLAFVHFPRLWGRRLDFAIRL
jgi:hypothetical protein